MSRSITLDPVYRQFMLEITADPSDLTPRMVCADWLEDNGQADRADFIRSMIRNQQARQTPGGLREWDRLCEVGLDNLSRWMLPELGRFGWEFIEDRPSSCNVRLTPPATEFVHGGPLLDWYTRRKNGSRMICQDFSLVVRNGWVEEVRVTPATWRNYGPELVLWQPVQAVMLSPNWVSSIGMGRFAVRHNQTTEWVYPLVQGGVEDEYLAGIHGRVFKNPLEATLALSNALMTWALTQWTPRDLRTPYK